ncbi:hypothetical protein Tco_0494198 [Tanacetum coccineum]
MQTTEDKVDSSKALDASLVDTESSGTTLKEQDTSSRSGNDSHVDVADSGPIMLNSHMAEGTNDAEIMSLLSGTTAYEQPNSIMKERAPFLNVKVMSVHISLGLVLHQMTSDHNRSELGIQDHSNETVKFKSWFQKLFP